MMHEHRERNVDPDLLEHFISMVSIDVVETPGAMEALERLRDITSDTTNTNTQFSESTMWVCPPEFYDPENSMARCYRLYSKENFSRNPFVVAIKIKPDRSGL